MISERSAVSEIVQLSRAIGCAEAPPDVFRLLMAASRAVAPRSAVLLVRHGEIHGWTAAGYASEICQGIRAYRAPLEGGWLGELAADPEVTVEPRPQGVSDPDFGQPASSESVAGTVRVKGKPIAFVFAERRASEGPWSPEGLALAILVAQLRLELNLALRKGERVAAEPGPSRTQAPAPPSDPLPAKAVAEVAPAAAPTAAATEPPEIVAARRYARLVATDIRLYNEDAVALGRRNRDLVERLAEQLGRGREAFLRRHRDLGSQGMTLLHEAFVQVLAGGESDLIPRRSLD
jgi:hypothetical protein